MRKESLAAKKRIQTCKCPRMSVCMRVIKLKCNLSCANFSQLDISAWHAIPGHHISSFITDQFPRTLYYTYMYYIYILGPRTGNANHLLE